MDKKSEMLRGAPADWYRGCKPLTFGDYFGSLSSLSLGETYLTYDRRHIVHRGDDGISVSRNICTHAGAQLLTTPGVQDVVRIQCPIHKWAFNPDGKHVASPNFRKCEGADLRKEPYTLWNGYLIGFNDAETKSLARFGQELDVPMDAFNPKNFVFMGEERRDLPYPRELMGVNYFDGDHVPLYHQKTFAAVANCDTYDWEFSEKGEVAGYSIQLVQSLPDVEKKRKQVMRSYGVSEEDVGWATFHLWLKEELRDVTRPIDPTIFALWASVYGNGCLMPELYEGGLFLAVSYLVNEDPTNRETGNANLVEWYVHENVPEELRRESFRRFKHAYDQSADEDDEICARLWEAHRRGGYDFDRIYHEVLEAGDAHFRAWMMQYAR